MASTNKKGKDQSLMPIFVAGVIVLAVCTLLCAIYIADIQKRYKQETEDNLGEHMEAAGQMIADYTARLQQDTVRAARSLEKLGSDERSSEQIRSALAEYESFHSFDDLMYVDKEGNVYFRNETPYFEEGSEQLNSILADLSLFTDEAAVKFVDNYKSQETYGVALVSVPVYGEDELRVGSVISVKGLSGMLEEETAEYLRGNGQIFLIDEEGIIYDLAVTDEKQLSNQESRFFIRLRTMARNSTRDRQTIERLKSSLSDSDRVLVRLGASLGSGFYVMVVKINAAQGLFLAECFPEAIFKNVIGSIVGRSILLCALIFLLVMVIVVFMWHYMRKSSDAIRELAYTDSVTHGMNFNYFLEQAAVIIKENQEIPYLLQRFDISNFRYINEAYGHARADELLAVVISKSQELLNSKELCVRMDADQFVVLAQNNLDYMSRFAVFEDGVNMQALDMGIKFPIRFKSGVYQIRRDDYDIKIMIDHANVARKSLDSNSKETYAFFTDHIVEHMRKVDEIESEQQNALINGEFKVYLQPKWDIDKDKFYGAEALVRWIKDDGNMVYPDTFIPIFENNGFIEQLDFYMLEQVCARIRKLLDEGKEPFPISVNQSRRLWDNPEYVENVGRVLEKYDVPSRYIDLEVTETVFFGERDKMLRIITQLKQKDVLLSMDDFGSGYSSLNLLKDIPFDILKIDKDFFSESITSKSSIWILKKIVEMAEGLGIHVLCEGVETKEQIHLLKDIGCQYVQGYFYSKPIPFNDFLEKYNI